MTSNRRKDAWLRLSSWLGPLVAAVSGIVSSYSIKSVWPYRDILISTLPVWGTILAIVVVGVGFYVVRGRFRLFYGVNETFLGFFASVQAFVPRFEYEILTTAEWLQVIAGLYIVVRGLDNIGKALEGTPWHAGWRWLSGERVRV
jgi:hypothetical protein